MPPTQVASTSSTRARASRSTEIRGAVFGHIRGVPVGRRWESRKEMAASCIHPPIIAGIYGRKALGAYSVVLNGEFEDEDHGDHFTYIGSGGRESGVRFGPQTCDQSWDNSRNEALRMSARRKTPVRVIRGFKLNSEHAPSAGYRYDGLYQVSNPRIEKASSGFNVCKFDFTRCSDQMPLPRGDGDPDSYRSDIDIRREQWKQYRQSQRDAEAPESSTSRSSPSLVGASRNTPISIDDDDDENVEEDDQEDVFGDVEDVEEEMKPVQEYLSQMQKPCPEEEKKKRAKALLPIGRHVNKVLAEKEKLGRDEAGRDVKWWYDALWAYVAAAMPSEHMPSPQKTEEWFNKWEAKAKNLKRQREADESEASSSTSTRARRNE